ncbi:DnaJ domain-containing protein [Hoeflea olei]|uniref:Molecular chaperone DnaJ n=1 Tax=Hoeflea olei TaxID=1480615 RepID=A0A1C1YSX1_9HYPH|nr:molecular chaperone DnaJ [Hoeflea olei]
MSPIALFFGGILMLVAVVLGLVRVPATHLARILRYGVPVALGGFGVVLTLIGRAGIGMPVIAVATMLFGRARAQALATRSAGGYSHVRSAALEMELDLDTGAMNGLVLAGSFEGRELDALDEAELVRLHGELARDAESLALLEAYLDRRIADWRSRLDPDEGAGLGAAPGAGAMTEQEAYEILGLAAGASEAEIREAHRRLMKRMHPDTGGSTFLAGRINEAKTVLLNRHN